MLVLDTDPGQDDAVALLLAFAHRAEFDIKLVATVAGNVALDKTTANALRIRDLAARDAALRFARVARTRMGWGRHLSDRYSSQVGQVIEGDEGRVACLMAIKAWVGAQPPGAAVPSNRAALQGIADEVAKNS
jgi:hypothetical protein